MPLAIDLQSIAVNTSAISTYHFFVYRIFERPILLFLNGVQDAGTPVVRQYRFPEAIYAAVRHGITPVTINDPVISSNSHAL